MGLLLLIAAGIAWWAWNNRPAPNAALAEARTLLDLPADADAEAIRAAHRRLIARVHPDHGGSAALTARVNAARDLLLAQIDRRA